MDPAMAAMIEQKRQAAIALRASKEGAHPQSGNAPAARQFPGGAAVPSTAAARRHTGRDQETAAAHLQPRHPAGMPPTVPSTGGSSTSRREGWSRMQMHAVRQPPQRSQWQQPRCQLQPPQPQPARQVSAMAKQPRPNDELRHAQPLVQLQPSHKPAEVRPHPERGLRGGVVATHGALHSSKSQWTPWQPTSTAPQTARLGCSSSSTFVDVELAVDKELGGLAVLKALFPAHIARAALATEVKDVDGVRVLDGVAGGPRKLICPLLCCHELQQALLKQGVQLKANGDTATAALKYRPALSEEESECLFDQRLPAELRSRLMPYQRLGILFALRHGGRVLLADEMGLGKSLQAMCTAWVYRSEWPCLVICPKSLCATWRTEIRKWLPAIELEEMGVYECTGGKDSVLPWPNGLTIMSYEIASRRAEELRNIGFRVIIADESHSLKSGDSQRTKAIMPLLKAAKRALLLSGTPLPSRPSEIFPQAKALRPGIFHAQKEFEIRYCNGRHDRYGWNTKGASNLSELHAILTHTMMIRREKAIVLKELPDKLRSQVLVSVPEAAELWKAHGAKQREKSQQIDVAPQHNPELTRIYMQTGESKIPAVVEQAERLLQGEGLPKLLIFAHHKQVVNELETRLQSRYGTVRIDGDCPAENRNFCVQRFQNEKEVRVAVLSIKVAAFGLTLTAASMVLFAELSWNASDLLQAEDRVHRISQKAAAVTIFYCLAETSIDELIWGLVERKLSTTSSIVSGVRSVMSTSDHEKTARPPVSIRSFFGASSQEGESASSACVVETPPHRNAGSESACRYAHGPMHRPAALAAPSAFLAKRQRTALHS